MVQNKIHTLNNLSVIVSRLKSSGKGKKIIQCHGCFDLIHPGHIRHLASAKKRGDVLAVTVTSDRYVHKGPGRPVFNDQLRAEALASLVSVDYVAINDAPNAVPAINLIRPDIYIKGSEFEKTKDMTGGIDVERAAVEAIGGQVEFTDDLTFSSTKLINEFLAPYSEKAQEFLRQFKKRFSFADIAGYFEKIKNYKVLVIGEAIIDEYHYVKTMHKSPKEAIIATRYESEESFAGGVLACANHVAGYCQNVDLVTCLGKQDSKEEFIRKNLKPNVKPKFFYDLTAPTIVKRRFIDPTFLTKMFEIYYFNDRPISFALEQAISDYLKKVLSDYDLVIAVDYGHGFLTARLREFLSQKAKFLALNTQTNSANFGFHVVTKYPRADYVCIDHLEARLAFQQKDISSSAEWQNIVGQITKKLKTKKTMITLGHEGCLSFDGKKTYQIPVLSTKVLDRVGAGDAFLAITSPLAKAGMSAEALGFVGNAVGALAVMIVGNRQAVEPVPLFKSINTMLKS